jgi:hypothetical protein
MNSGKQPETGPDSEMLDTEKRFRQWKQSQGLIGCTDGMAAAFAGSEVRRAVEVEREEILKHCCPACEYALAIQAAIRARTKGETK